MSRLPVAILALWAMGLRAAEPLNGASQQVEQVLRSYAVENGPGCAVGVLFNKRVVYEGAAGTRDGTQPLTSSTPFYLASVSKQFTAAAVYRLANRGIIRLDDSVRTWIPELPAFAAAITARHLLQHTSGLRDYSALQEVAGLSKPLDNMAVLRLLSAQRELNFVPGTDFEYSNSEYVLLSLLVQRASGLLLPDYAKRELFGPLGMTRSWFQSGIPAGFETATGYAGQNERLRPASAVPLTTGDGGMYSSVSDLLLWLSQFDRRGTARDIMQPIQSRARLRSGEVLPHASGLFWGRYKGHTTLSHNGAVAGFQADVVHVPARRLSVVCLCNRGDINAMSITRRIADVYLGTPSRMGPAVSLRHVSPRTIPADLVGRWESRQGFLLSTVVQGDHVLASIAGTTFQLFVGSQPSTFNTRADGVQRHLRRRGPDRVEIWWDGDRKQVFHRLPGLTPSQLKNNSFAGRFLNQDVRAEWLLVVTNEALTITTNTGWQIPLTAVAPDRFEVGPWVLQFQRDKGLVTGFDLHRERLWNLRFRKETAER